jgi:WD40 repeat protein
MISFDPVAPLLASSGTDASVNIWNLQTGKLLRKYRSERGSISAVTFSPDGQQVASASKASSILIRDLANGKETSPACPGKVSMCRPFSTSQSLTVRSSLPETSHLPSGLNASDKMLPLWPVNARIRLAVPRSQIQIWSSHPAEATISPFGLIATQSNAYCIQSQRQILGRGMNDFKRQVL